MATLNATTIKGNLKIAGSGSLYLPAVKASWVNGLTNSPIKIDDASTTGDYYPWISQTNSASGYRFTLGTYQQCFILGGKIATATDNSFTHYWRFNISDGTLKLDNSHTYMHSGNYGSWVPSKTGSGASGTWGINISGNAAGLSSTLAINKGGTNNTSFTSNRLLYYDGTRIKSCANVYCSGASISVGTTANTTTYRVLTKNGNNAADLRVSTSAGIYHDGTAAGSSNSKWLIYINTSGTVTANTSDRRRKKYIEDTTEYETLSILSNIKVRNFIYKDDIGHNNLVQNGIFAQDLRDIMKKYNIDNRPWLQYSLKGSDEVYYDVKTEETNEMTYEVNYPSLIPLLIKGWQINENKISLLQEKIKELEEM